MCSLQSPNFRFPIATTQGQVGVFCCVQGHSLPQQYCKLMSPFIPILKIYLPIKTDLDFFFGGGHLISPKSCIVLHFQLDWGGKNQNPE